MALIDLTVVDRKYYFQSRLIRPQKHSTNKIILFKKHF